MHNRRHRHGCAWMPGVGLLHTVHRQRADGVDAQPVESCVGCHLHTSSDDRDKVTRNHSAVAHPFRIDAYVELWMRSVSEKYPCHKSPPKTNVSLPQQHDDLSWIRTSVSKE